jgi:hypothetical protein
MVGQLNLQPMAVLNEANGTSCIELEKEISESRVSAKDKCGAVRLLLDHMDESQAQFSYRPRTSTEKG